MARCPGCFVPLVRVEEETLRFSTCGNCFGTWIGSVALLRRTRMDLEGDPFAGDTTSLAELAEVVAASNTKTALRCSACEKPMVKDKFHPMIPVMIDRCRACAMVWLDAGEMALLRRLSRELMTTEDPEIVRRREKVGTVNMQWEARSRLQEETAASVVNMSEGFDLLSYMLRL